MDFTNASQSASRSLAVGLSASACSFAARRVHSAEMARACSAAAGASISISSAHRSNVSAAFSSCAAASRSCCCADGNSGAFPMALLSRSSTRSTRARAVFSCSCISAAVCCSCAPSGRFLLILATAASSAAALLSDTPLPPAASKASIIRPQACSRSWAWYSTPFTAASGSSAVRSAASRLLCSMMPSMTTSR